MVLGEKPSVLANHNALNRFLQGNLAVMKMSPFYHPVHKMNTEMDTGRNISHTGGDRRGQSNDAVKFRNSYVFISV